MEVMFQGGYTGKFLRIDLSAGKIKAEKLDEETARKYWGGRGWGGYLLLKELESKLDPFSSKNKIFFLTGPLQGTLTPFAPKFVVITKSPLTGTFTRVVAGGQWGPELKFAGYDGVIVEGKSAKPVYIFIDDDKVEIRDGTHLWGLTTGETENAIKKDLNDKTIQVLSIGQAGEKKVRFASVIHESRAAARGGTGAVMGSKNLKAIAVRGTGNVVVADLARFKNLLVEAYEAIKSNPAYPGRVKYGTSGTVSVAHGLGVMPVRNYSSGVFEEIEGLIAETMRKKIVIHDESCFACSVPCGKLSLIKEGPYGGTVLQGPQYETIGLLGTNCGISSIEAVARANYLCNEYGMDTISTGNVMAYAIEAYQRGFLTKSDVDGVEMRFGDPELVLGLIDRIAKREGLGNKLAEGVKAFSQELGREASKFAMHGKGQEFACFEPRSVVGLGLLYATATTGANHSFGNTFREEMRMGDLVTGKGKAKLVVESQNSYCLMDSAIYCSFSRFTGLEHIPRLQILSAVTGWNYSEEDFQKQANRIYTVERLFNLRQGFERKDDTLPYRSLAEPMPDGPAKGNVVPLEEMLPEFYSLRRWDESGKPIQETLEALSLGEFTSLL
jgi:aldehyde:ferredoxin oxidoreductase